MGPGPAQRGASDHGSLPLKWGMCNTRFDADLARKRGISGSRALARGPDMGPKWAYSRACPEPIPSTLRVY